MSELSMMVTITTRNLTKKFVAFYEEMDMPVSVITLGSGTASSEILDYFGQNPIIVRSSSLLEDGFGNAFAGKYESVFCVNRGSLDERLEAFEEAR